MTSDDYHATVRLEKDGWVARIFANWTTEHPVLIGRCAYPRWIIAVTYAVADVIAYRNAYNRNMLGQP
jgi:hypothetical protein